MIEVNRNVFWYGLSAVLFSGLFVLFFVTGFAIPCHINPFDCSGRDIAMVIVSLPTSYVMGWLISFLPDAWLTPIGVQMGFLLFSGVIQYGVLGWLFVWCVYCVRSLRNKGK